MLLHFSPTTLAIVVLWCSQLAVGNAAAVKDCGRFLGSQLNPPPSPWLPPNVLRVTGRPFTCMCKTWVRNTTRAASWLPWRGAERILLVGVQSSPVDSKLQDGGGG